MPNVVEITVRLNNDTAAGFVGVLASIEAVKKAAQGVGFNFDPPNLTSQLMQLKQKMQAAGLADLIDYNLNQGQIQQQILMLKRRVQQAGLSDLLDVNLNQGQIAEQLGELTSEEIDIPVGFNVDKFPVVGDIAPVSVPIKFDLGKIPELPKLGGTFDFKNIEQATADFKNLGIAADALQKPLFDVDNLSTVLDASFANTASSLDSLGMAFSNAAKDAVAQSESNHLVAIMSQMAQEQLMSQADAAKLNATALVRANIAQEAANAAMKDAIPLWQSGGGWWGFLTGHVQLFGGAMTSVGIPAIIGTASGFHILTDAIIETATVLIPATIGIIAFGAAAAPTVGDIYQRMLAVFNVSRALGQEIYPMSGAFLALANDVQPQVYMLFGEALSVMNSRTSEFATLAEGAGTAVDHLGARLAAALESNDLKSFLGNAASDITGIGNFFGNLFGIIGNILHVMPGYAEDLLSILDDVSGGIESLTSNGVVQWLLGVGIAFHGAVLWLGLFTTAIVWAGNGLVGFLGQLGLVEEGALAFDAIQFGTGLKLFMSYLLDTGIALVTFSGAEDIAAGATGILESAMLALGAVNPLVWVGLAIGALAGLAVWLIRSGDDAKTYANNMKNALEATPVSNLNINLLIDQSNAMHGLVLAQEANTKAQDNYDQSIKNSGPTRYDWNAQTRQASDNLNSQSLAVQDVAHWQSNYNQVLATAHGNMALVNQAGITSQQIIGASKNQLAQYIIEVQSLVDAQNALAVGQGRAAAALNAESNLYITEGIPAMQKMTQAEDAVFNNIIGGEAAFYKFATALNSTQAAAKASGDSMNGLGKNAVLLGQDFYESLLPTAQSLIDSLQQQDIGTKNLTQAIADEVKQMVPFTKGNAAAKSVLVDMINNALGPGTVSMKTLNSWVDNNSTSLSKFNKIIGESTIQAGSLANVLSTSLNKQFTTALLNESGASQALQSYTQDIINNSTKTAAGKSDRQQLIDDLINVGDTAQQARRYVDSLQTSVDGMHGKSIGVGVVGAWSVQKEENAQAVAHLTEEAKHGYFSTGGKVPGWGGGDVYPAWLEPGEAIVDKDRTRKHSALLGWMGVPGFSSGGMMGVTGMPADASSLAVKDANSTMNALVAALIRSDEAAARRALIGGSSSAIVNYAESFIGKVPYVWGGDTPNGWDCSGFVQYVYDHFGYSPPRTSEAQWGWVRHTPTPVPGGLAFFAGSDGTQANPGHVGIVVDNNDMVDAYATGFGTRFNRIQGSSGAISGFGVPPGGLSGGGGPGGGGPGGGSPARNASLAHSLYASQLAGPVWADWNSVAMAESGWSNIARNPGSGAYGIAQALPYTKYPKAGWPPWAGGSANPTAQINWMWDYMAGTYGGPVGAWQHEQQFHWYKDGLDAVFNKPTMIGVGEAGTEHVTVTPGGRKPIRLIISAGDSGEYTRFLTQELKKYIRVEGGGDVQIALGYEE